MLLSALLSWLQAPVLGPSPAREPRFPAAPVRPLASGPGPVVTNVGVAAYAVLPDGPVLAVGVLEFEQGVDRNGDGDTLDRVLALYDLDAGTLTNLAIAHEAPASVHGERVVVAAYEAPMGTDLNGDGDLADDVVLVCDLARGTTWNTGLCVVHTPLAISARLRQTVVGETLAVAVSEAGAGLDLNGDGDAEDEVLRLVSLRRPGAPPRAVQAGGRQELPGTLALDARPFVPVGDRILVEASEHQGGQADLNGDGDATDLYVLHVQRPDTGRTVNLGLSLAYFQPLQAVGRRALFLLNEAAQQADSNGDGDQSDFVVHVLDLDTLDLRNTHLATNGGQPVLLDDVLACSVSEARQGGTDLDGDGDTADSVLHLVDLASGTTTNLGLPSFDVGLAGAGAKLLCAVPEFGLGADLNGDGDAADRVLHTVTTAGLVTNLATAVQPVLVTGERLATVLVHEAAQGSDYNFDGDLADQVLAIYDGALDRFTSTALAVLPTGAQQLLAGRWLAFLADEAGQGADLNGDGDAGDRVLHLFDADAATTVNLGLAVQSTANLGLSSAVLTACVSEAFQGADLNGDGDALDRVLHVVDLR